MSASDEADVEHAAQLLRRGGIVAFPTETVYGLGANALDARAVARVFEVKGRPRFDPLIVHVAEPKAAAEWIADWDERMVALAERFWPGPLTLVLKKRPAIPDLVTAGLPNVAVRVPDHPLALRLLARAGVPVAAPSANRFGAISPTTAQHVRDSLGGDVDLLLDGGPCRAGVESTVISLVGPQAELLRPGALPLEDVEAAIGTVRVAAPPTEGAAAQAPGMQRSHYAPATPLFRADAAPDLRGRRIGRLCFTAPDAVGDATEVLSRTGDLREAAANLFAAMRRLDALRLDAIVADRFPPHGLGRAIEDRLDRAAARRERA